MQARDIMTRDVITISPEADVQDAIRRLAEFQISGMPVIDLDAHIIGIVTEADVLGRIGAHVSDIMTRRVITVTEDTVTERIAQLLTGKRIKRVPVVRDGVVVGVVSRADVVRLMASRWTCGVCGAIHLGAMPQECDACGAPGHIFGRQVDIRSEMSRR